nr:hypothetical protein [Tanacetum cinerariifolium]
RLQDLLQRENDEFLRNIDENMKKVLKGLVKNQVKEQVSRILPWIEESVNATLEAEVLTRSSHSSRTSYAITADLSEMELKKILIEKMEGNKSIQRSDEQRNLYKALVKAYESDKAILDTYGDSTILKRRREDDDQEGPSAGPNRGSKRQKEGGEQASASTPSEKATKGAGKSTTGSQSRQRSASKSAYAEKPVQTTCQMEETPHPVYGTGVDDQPIVQTTQHPEWFSQPRRPPLPDRAWNIALPAAQSWISNLAKQADEVYKATTDQLDWVNPEGQQYPHNLLQPLPLIPNNRGRRLILFEHFINNDLEYLRGGASSRKYITSVTKTKAADYGHIKWIEDLFYGYAVNRESARDVYSKRRIIAVTELQIMEWHDYKHLDWISNYLQQPMPNPEDITDSTTAMNMALALMVKAFKLNYSTPTNNNQRISSNPRNRQIAQPGMNIGQDRQMQIVAQNPRVQNVENQNGPIGVQGNGNQNQIGNGNLVAVRGKGNAARHNGNHIRCYNCRGIGHFARDCTVRPRRRDAAYLQTQLLIAQKEEAGI